MATVEAQGTSGGGSPRRPGTVNAALPLQSLKKNAGLPPAGVSSPMPEQTVTAAVVLEGFARTSFAGRTSLAGLAATQ